MPIVSMISAKEYGMVDGEYKSWDRTEFPEGAYCDLHWTKQTEAQRSDPIILVETHQGLCLREREMNGYDDSDFYMLVWNEEKGEPEEICFASTRGWTYPCCASRVDATEEVRAKHAAWWRARCDQMARERRAERAGALLELRSRSAQLLGAAGLSETEILRVRRLRHDIGGTKFEGLLGLFGKRIRSKFKISLREQVIAWAKGESEYSSPLSRRQLDHV